MKTGWLPLCLDAEEAEAYRRGRIGGCRDCTAAYADEMRADGRCNGVPGELTAGIVEEEPMNESVDLPVRAVVTIAAPCASCAHEAVCRIRPELEQIKAAQVALPRIDDVRVSVAATVECGHYVRLRGSKPAPVAGRKLDLSPEERERRRQRALDMNAARKAGLEAAPA